MRLLLKALNPKAGVHDILVPLYYRNNNEFAIDTKKIQIKLIDVSVADVKEMIYQLSKALPQGREER